MPKWLVFGAIGAVILLVLVMTWLNNRSLDAPDNVTNVEAAAPPAPAQPAPQPAVVAGQPVVLSATAPVWFQVYEKGGATLFSGTLQPGQSFAVPATATAPLLRTGKPEALQARVGNAIAPPVGPAATKVSDVSLLGADLMKGGTATAAAASPAPATGAPQPRPRRTRTPAANVPAPAPAPAEAPPPTTNTGA